MSWETSTQILSPISWIKHCTCTGLACWPRDSFMCKIKLGISVCGESVEENHLRSYIPHSKCTVRSLIGQSDQIVSFVNLQRWRRLSCHCCSCRWHNSRCSQVAPNELYLHGFSIELHIVVPFQCSNAINLSRIDNLCSTLPNSQHLTTSINISGVLLILRCNSQCGFLPIFFFLRMLWMPI